jgi:hypothetical protein
VPLDLDHDRVAVDDPDDRVIGMAARSAGASLDLAVAAPEFRGHSWVPGRYTQFLSRPEQRGGAVSWFERSAVVSLAGADLPGERARTFATFTDLRVSDEVVPCPTGVARGTGHGGIDCGVRGTLAPVAIPPPGSGRWPVVGQALPGTGSAAAMRVDPRCDRKEP